MMLSEGFSEARLCTGLVPKLVAYAITYIGAQVV